MHARQGLVLLLLMGLSPLMAHAATYYVDTAHPSASNSNPGTEALPWKTPYQVNTAPLQPGDTVYVKAGTYDVSTGGDWYRPAIQPPSGTPGNPITLAAYPGHTVVMDLHQTSRSNPAMGTYTESHIVIDGFIFANCGVGACVVVRGESRVQGIVIQYTTMSGVYQAGGDNTDLLRLENTSGTIVRGNRLFNVHNGENSPNAAGIKLYRNDHALIEHNEIYDAVACIHDKANGEFNTYRRNRLHDCTQGILFQNGETVSVQGNQVYENLFYETASPLQFWTWTQGLVRDTSIYNNTFALYGDTAFQSPQFGANTRAWNNILYRTAPARDFMTFDDPPTSLPLSNYQLFALGPNLTIGQYQTNRTFTDLPSWQAAYGRDANSLVANPMFVDASGGDYHLAAGSPALNAGRVGGVSTGAVVHLGAYTTGTEVIGPGNGGTPTPPPDQIPPMAPTGLTVQMLP